MSEKCDRQSNQEVANHPAVRQLLKELGEKLGTTFFIVGSGTPEQEAEHAEWLRKQEEEEEAARAKFNQEHAVSAETFFLLARCLAKK